MRQVLFIAHHFPPIGGAGVQRAVKLVKYLPEAGLLPTVVTGSGTDSGWWSPSDKSMLDEIPGVVKVYRAQVSNSNGSTGAMSDQRSKALGQLGERAARATASEVVFVTMSPFQDAQVASHLSRRLQIPWVADLRDPWALDEFRVYRSRTHRVADRLKMAWALRTASLIVMNTPEAAARLRTLPGLRRKRIVCVTNGYDAEDFAGSLPAVPRNVFTIVHAGFLHTAAGFHQRRHARQYRWLGRMESGVEILTRSHFYLLQALDRWSKENPSIRNRVEVVLVGKPSATDLEIVNASPAGSFIRFTGYVSHAESLRLIRTASLLFLPMHKLPSGRRATIVPGKTYEYMATGLPILAPVPEGDARDFLRRAGTGLFCEPDDVGAMSRILDAQFQAWSGGQRVVNVDRRYVEQFERRHLAQQLAAEMVALCRA